MKLQQSREYYPIDILHIGWNLALQDHLEMERYPSLKGYWGTDRAARAIQEAANELHCRLASLGTMKFSLRREVT